MLGPLLFMLYTYDMWFGLENMLNMFGSFADDVPSPNFIKSY